MYIAADNVGATIFIGHIYASITRGAGPTLNIQSYEYFDYSTYLNLTHTYEWHRDERIDLFTLSQ